MHASDDDEDPELLDTEHCDDITVAYAADEHHSGSSGGGCLVTIIGFMLLPAGAFLGLVWR